MKRFCLIIGLNLLLVYCYNYFVIVIVIFFLVICDGKINLYGVCILRYINDRILKRDGSVYIVSGGMCLFLDRCMGCNDGFYLIGLYCESKI